MVEFYAKEKIKMYWISENWKPMYVIQQTMFDIEVCSQYRENCKIELV